MSSLPLVSCIMPTRNRRRFVGQAIWYFLRQDYSAKELVIVDDGDDPVGDLVPKDERIRYHRVDGRLSVGAKRNLACNLSRGEFIAHWDDDDWSAPNRLTVQARTLQEARADLCGGAAVLHYALMSGEAWLYRCAAHERPAVAGCTLLYRRSLWSQNPFAEVDVGEDTAFVGQAASACVHAIRDTTLWVALIHGGNTAPKHLTDPHWERRPLDEVARLLALDRQFYVELRNGRGRVAGKQRPTSSVTLAAHFVIYDGYGSMSEYLTLGIARAGARVNVVPLSLDPTGYSAEFKQIVEQSRPEPGAPTLYSGWVRAELERLQATGDIFVHTMWESSRLPAGWPEWLNRCRVLFVPTRFCARVCRDSGVTVPIEVAPDGVDPEIYRYQDRPQREGITTLMVGPVVERKHTLEGIAAWKHAFAGDATARLILKARFGYRNYAPDDPRISVVDANEPTRGIAHWYQQADILMALGNEGFGLPLVEGLATGLPVVALDTEGQADVCQDARPYLLPVPPSRWEPCVDQPFGACGVRGIPDVEAVAARLRWITDHREEAWEMARAGSAWVLEHRNVWTKGPLLLDAMEKAGHPARPLRRTRTLWVPSWESPCGISEYARHLMATLPTDVRVAKVPPDVNRVRLLHVQHEDGIFDESVLVTAVQEAKHAGVPVVVTEHSVGMAARAWEREADLLLAMTTDGAARLQARWPNQRVQYLPLGCPTWFPPRKGRKGHVIGAFGFLAPHKGFWQLLDVLREVKGSELVLYSYARSAELETRWEEAAKGLPVRRVREFLPIEDVARRLAAETDVMAFWYDEVPQASASSAICVALATGTPVLASPTRWFADLRHVTYQPTSLTQGILRLLSDDSLRRDLATAAYGYCHENSWPRIAERHLALWRELEAA